jgi:hypothetical protein
LAVGSLFSFFLLFAMDMMGRGSKNPYLGILSYLVSPAFLILGLAMIFLGAWHQHRSRMRGQVSRPLSFAIDLARPRDRWMLIWFGVGSLGFMLLSAVGSYQTFQYTESVSFCGEVCHTLALPASRARMSRSRTKRLTRTFPTISHRPS